MLHGDPTVTRVSAPPPLPAELRPLVCAALTEFFLDLKQYNDKAERFALACPEECADVLAGWLCGKSHGLGGTLQATAASEALPAAAEGGYTEGSSVEPPEISSNKKRVLLTGCFDLMHAGHYNALRQAKMAFPGCDVTLVAGVHGDEAIETAKGAPTVCTNAERVAMVEACRWVDEVVGDLPYAVPVSLLDRLRCDVAVHGDDLPRVSDGTGLFDELLAAGRLHIVKRTEGTSTTVLIGRLLSMSKEHLQKSDDHPNNFPRLVSAETGAQTSPLLEAALPAQSRSTSRDNLPVASSSERARPRQCSADVTAPLWMLLPTMSRMAVFFGDRPRRLGAERTVVYAPGEWDLFHVGHVRFLELARKFGDFLIVGCYSDETIHKKKGKNYPLQTLHERALNVLACKYVDDVVLSAPWRVSADLLTTLNVSIVVTGKNNIYAEPIRTSKDPLGLGDPFEHPRATGILHMIESDCSLTMDVIAERIVANTIAYTIRQNKKEKVELEYNEGKTFVAES